MKITPIFFVFIMLCLITEQLSSQNWTKVEGTYPFINVIFVTEDNPDLLVVAADNAEIESPFNPLDDVINFPQFGGGIFISLNRGGTFADAKLATFSVYDIAQNPENTAVWYASARRLTRGGITTSTDGGSTWNESTPFACDGSFQLMSIATNDLHYPDIYAAGLKTDKGFFHSNDDFQNCSTKEGFAIQSRSVAVSPIKNDLIFIAGDDFYASGVYRSYNKGETWIKDSIGIDNLRIHCVLPSNVNPAIVYCGADSVTNMHTVIGRGIYMSLDTGKTWNHVADIEASCLDLAQHPYEKKFIVAACGYGGVYLSGSEGYGFEKVSSGLPDGAIITKVAFPYWDAVDNKVIAFAGTYGDGLYKSGLLYTSVNNDYTNEIVAGIESIYPNPANTNISIVWKHARSQKVSIRVHDSYSKTVIEIDEYFIQAGENIIEIPLMDSMSSGIYFLVITANDIVATEKFTVIK